LPVEQSRKNTLILRRRRRRSVLRSSAEITQKNSRSLCTIAEASASRKIQTMVTSSVYSRAAWQEILSTPKNPNSFGRKIGWP
jgi:hypothetical protein